MLSACRVGFAVGCSGWGIHFIPGDARILRALAIMPATIHSHHASNIPSSENTPIDIPPTGHCHADLSISMCNAMWYGKIYSTPSRTYWDNATHSLVAAQLSTSTLLSLPLAADMAALAIMGHSPQHLQHCHLRRMHEICKNSVLLPRYSNKRTDNTCVCRRSCSS